MLITSSQQFHVLATSFVRLLSFICVSGPGDHVTHLENVSEEEGS